MRPNNEIYHPQPPQRRWHEQFTGGSITPVPIVDITGNNNLNIHAELKFNVASRSFTHPVGCEIQLNVE